MKRVAYDETSTHAVRGQSHGETMQYSVADFGFSPWSLLKSPEEVGERLKAILDDKVLRFNPYAVDDGELLACVERAYWRPWPAMTQMVVFHCHDVRRVNWKCPYDALFFHIGNMPEEYHMSMNRLTCRFTYAATLRQVHVTVNDRPLTNDKMVQRMQGKDYFVSHALPERAGMKGGHAVYRMYRLKGSDAGKAELIRRKMVEAKICMLNEILSYPYTPQYLHCSRNFIDYATPISTFIEAFRRYPEYRR